MPHTKEEQKHSIDSCLADLQELVAEPEFLQLMEEIKADLPDKETYRDLSVGLKSVASYMERKLPELAEGGKKIIDVGPGVGTFMLLARALDNDIIGEEVSFEAGPGYIEAYSRIAEHWGLDVNYYGFHRYCMGANYARKDYDLIHFRGSMDAIVVSMQLPYNLCLRMLFGCCEKALAVGGEVFIAHNAGPVTDCIIEVLPNELDHTSLVLWPSDEGYTRLKKE